MHVSEWRLTARLRTAITLAGARRAHARWA